MEGKDNAIAARVAGLEESRTSLFELHREHSHQLGGLDREQGIQGHRVTEVEGDIENLGGRIDRMTRAFWGAAAAMAGLALSGLAIVATILARGS